MFYERFIQLCEENNIKPTPLLRQLGLSAGNLKNWQKGASVNSDILQKLSMHFNVSIDYLVTGKEITAPMEQLSENEQEMLDVFSKFNDREQIKLIGKLEELYRQKQIKESQQPAALKVSRSPDKKFRRTEISKEELERINNLPEDNDI